MVLETHFGLAFDPVTGNLWDTENGEDEYDEINLAVLDLIVAGQKLLVP